MKYVDFHGYRVFSDGVITNKEKIMKPFLDKDGYLRIALTIEKKQKKFHVHRLVYQLFVGPILSTQICCHNDNNRTNNNYQNLRIDSQKNNIADKLKHGTWQAGEKHPRAKYTDSAVENLQILMKRHPHLPDSYIASFLGFPRSFIYDVRKGRRKTRQQRINERTNHDVHGN